MGQDECILKRASQCAPAYPYGDALHPWTEYEEYHGIGAALMLYMFTRGVLCITAVLVECQVLGFLSVAAEIAISRNLP